MKTQTTALVNNQEPASGSLLSQTPLQHLLHQPVTRKQFLKVAGFGVLSVFGFSTIIHLLTGKHPSAHIASVTSSATPRKGYGRH